MGVAEQVVEERGGGGKNWEAKGECQAESKGGECGASVVGALLRVSRSGSSIMERISDLPLIGYGTGLCWYYRYLLR